MNKFTKTFHVVLIIGVMLVSGISGVFAQGQMPVDSVCAGENVFYRVPATQGSSYDWFISEGGTPTYGVDIKNDSIRITWANSDVVSNEFVKVVETNKYGRKGDTIQLRVMTFPVPAASISGSDTLFDGNSGTDKVKINITGSGPWDVVYNDGKTDVTITGITDSPHTIQTRALSNPPEVHTFSLVSVKNKSGCVGQVSGAANIIVSPPIKTGNIIFR